MIIFVWISEAKSFHSELSLIKDFFLVKSLIKNLVFDYLLLQKEKQLKFFNFLV